MVSSTDPMGVTKTFTYDATGVLAGEVQPVTSASSVAVGFGYDLGGNQTAYTDGNGHATYATYNTLGLAESVIKPPAGANTSAGASTSTAVYDAAGNVVTQDLKSARSLTRKKNNSPRRCALARTSAKTSAKKLRPVGLVKPMLLTPTVVARGLIYRFRLTA